MPKKPTKHFLDTSVARSMLMGSQAYKNYFSGKFGKDSLYISRYVQMEFKRSYLRTVIKFYFTLNLPTIRTIDDALRLWSNRFAGSELTAIIQLASELFQTQRFNYTKASDKPKAIHALGLYIIRIELKLRRKFKDTGQDAARCARAAIPFKIDSYKIKESFKNFIEVFDDIQTCRKKCNIDQFILDHFSVETKNYVQIEAKLHSRTGINEGFVGVATALKAAIDSQGNACSCRLCGKIGDAVITLDTPRNIQLEHTDNSFNILCDSINQPHYHHPSETAVVVHGKS